MKKIFKFISAIGKKIPLRSINFVQIFGLDKFKKSAIISVAFIIFISSNILLSFISYRMDFSNGKAYTLSQSTRKLVKKLNKTLTLTFYVSSNIPATLQPLKREVEDVLREYEQTQGNIAVKIIKFDPGEDADVLAQVQGLGIRGTPIRQQAQSEISVAEVYFAIAIDFDGKSDVIPTVFDVENLEYTITSIIYQMTTENLPKIAVIGSESDIMTGQDPLGLFRQYTSKVFELYNAGSQQIQDPNVENGEKKPFIDPDTKTVILVDSPNKTYTDDEIAEIGKYLKTGNALFMLNGVTVDDNIQTGEPQQILLDLLKQYGIVVNKNLVLSGRSEYINIGGFGLPIPYPLWIWSSDFSNDLTYLKGVGRVTFPWASAIFAKSTDGYDAREIIFSGKQSWEQKNNFSLFPQQIPQPHQSDLKSFPLAVESVGKSAKNKIMAIGSSRFIQNNYMSRDSQNLEFVINILSEYASGGALSGISSRAINIYPIPDLPKKAQDIYKYGNILFLPGVLTLYGAYRLLKRNKKTN